MDGQAYSKQNYKLRKRFLRSMSVIGGMAVTLSCSATALNLAQSPLFLGNSAIPNITLMLDDSGSMDWEILTRPHWDLCAYSIYGNCASSQGTFMTTGEMRDNNNSGDYDEFFYIYNNTNLYDDSEFRPYNSYEESGRHGYYRPVASELRSVSNAESWGATTADWRVFSSELNQVYYNPDVVYSPWPGDAYQQASFTAATENPDGTGSTRDLINSIYVVADDDKGFSGDSPLAADYTSNYASSPNGLIDLWDSHTIYNIVSDRIYRYRVTMLEDDDNNMTRVSYTDLGAITDTAEVDAIKQNFANWYQYHRRRHYNLKGSLASLIQSYPDYRYMLGAINSTSMLTNAPADNNDLQAHNSQLIADMLTHPLSLQGTPLRRGLNLAGSNYMESGVNAPIENACQLNFTVLMTDSFWNGDYSTISSAGIGDVDGDGIGALADPGPTIADIASYYYSNDLRPDLADTVLANSFDSNVQQHMNTLMVSFGLEGSLTDSNNDGWPDENGVNLSSNSTSWGNPFLGGATISKINDLWHGAFNSKGRYIDLSESSSLIDSLGSLLATVDQRAGSAAAVTLAGANATSGENSIFQSKFSSIDWSGDVESYVIDSITGNVNSTPVWSAQAQLAAVDSTDRHIIFSRLSADADAYLGLAFTYNNLSTDEKSVLRTSQLSGFNDDEHYERSVINYIRGSDDYVQSSIFRSRSGKLGDIIHSSPVYVGVPSETSTAYSGIGSYTTFKSFYNKRDAVVYVGANDGMLHAFDASTGEEKFGFIPSALMDNLYRLADPAYSHRYYVNATPVAGDAYGNFNNDGQAWATMLVSGFGAGGKGLTALNITEPDDFSGSAADELVLWEFGKEDRTGSSDAHATTHPDTGHIYGKSSIVSLNNGQWVVITGNGYNSIENNGSTGEAVLFILDAATGVPLKVLATGAGSSASPNGLSEPVVVDVDNNGGVDIVYAGDLSGNIWKFDISSNSASDWSVAYTDNSNAAIPLFASGSAQPVTSGLTVGRHPTGKGRLVYFGTGRYLTVGDNSAVGQSDQAFYGIWDKDTANADFSAPITGTNLLSQEITLQTTFNVAVQNADEEDASSSITVTARETSRNSINWNTHKGWYLALVNPDSGNNGERVIEKAQLRNGRIIFTTLQPSTIACQVSGSSWLMELDAASGGRLTTTSLDVNQDGQFDEYDYSYINSSGSLQCSTASCVPFSGILFDEIIAPPAILASSGKETKYISGSSGAINKVSENPGQDRLGRQGWREIYLFLTGG